MNDLTITGAAICAHVLPLLRDPDAAVNTEFEYLPAGGPTAAHVREIPLAERVQTLCALFRTSTLDRVAALTLNLLQNDGCVMSPVDVLRSVVAAVDPHAAEGSVRVRVARARNNRLEGCRYYVTLEALQSPVAPDMLLRLRESTGLNGRAFAARVGVAPSVLSRWESGKQPLRMSTFAAMQAVIQSTLPDRVAPELLAVGAQEGWDVPELLHRAKTVEQVRVPHVPPHLLAAGQQGKWGIDRLLTEATRAAVDGESAPEETAA